MIRLFGKLLHQPLGRAHDKFKMRDVVTIIRSKHQKFVLRRGTTVQTIAAVKHEYFEGGNTVLGKQMLHFAYVRGLDRCSMIAVVNPETSFGLAKYFRQKFAVSAVPIELIMT